MATAAATTAFAARTKKEKAKERRKRNIEFRTVPPEVEIKSLRSAV